MLPATLTVAPERGSHASSDASSSVESCHWPAPCTRSGPSPSAAETIVPSRPNASRRASRAIEPLAIGQVPGSIQGEPSKSVTRNVPTARGSSSSDSRLPMNDTFAGSASVTVVPSRRRLPRAAAAKR